MYMKKKRIALLLAAVMTLSSISSTAAFASGVDASKEIAGSGTGNGNTGGSATDRKRGK